MFFCFVKKHVCDRQTNRRTDRQNYDPQDRASIAASRGKNLVVEITALFGTLSFPMPLLVGLLFVSVSFFNVVLPSYF